MLYDYHIIFIENGHVYFVLFIFYHQDAVMEGKIKTIIITHKDRFIRFGYDWFEKFCMKFNTTIVAVNNEELSPQEELVQDIVSILHVFSCRLYGLRKYKKQIERDEEIAKELQDGNKPVRGTEDQDP
mgnify:FL=1